VEEECLLIVLDEMQQKIFETGRWSEMDLTREKEKVCA
jgi:hypothetical protein